jgi:hypothetical protein
MDLTFPLVNAITFISCAVYMAKEMKYSKIVNVQKKIQDPLASRIIVLIL